MLKYNDGLDVLPIDKWKKENIEKLEREKLVEEFAKRHNIGVETASRAINNTEKLRENSVAKKSDVSSSKMATPKVSKKKKAKKSKVKQQMLKAASAVAVSVLAISMFVKLTGIDDRINHDKQLSQAIAYTTPAIVQVLSENDIDVVLVQDENGKGTVKIDYPEEQIDACMAIIQDEFKFSTNETLYAIDATGVEGEFGQALNSMGVTENQFLQREGYFAGRDTSSGIIYDVPSKQVFDNYHEKGFIEKVETHQELQNDIKAENTFGGK